MNRVFVFIDGGNFYFKLKEMKSKIDGKHSLLNFPFKQFTEYLAQTNKLVGVNYYLGAVKQQNNNEKSRKMFADQQRLFMKLQQQNINVVLGQLIQHPDKTYHEKGVDVRLAVEMIRFARQNKYDWAYLISSDTDLVPAIEEVQSFGKKVQYIGIPKGQSFGLSKMADDVRLLRPEEIKNFFRKIITQINMNPEKYFGFMRQTTYATEKMIFREIKKLEKIDESLFELISTNIYGRIATKRPKIRPGLVRLGYEICGGKNWRKILPICASIEILNVSTYTINRIFDEKGGKWNKDKINNNIIAGIIQKEIASDLLNKASGLVNYRGFIKIKSLFDEINKITYFGQFKDLNFLRIKNRLPLFEKFIEDYKQRCYFFGGRYYENSLLIGSILANGSKKQLSALQNFGKLFGTSLQMVNDIGDFVPPDKKPYKEAFKYYQDQYGDLRLSKLTLPIYLMLQNASGIEKKFILKQIGKKQTKLKDGHKLTKILITTGAFKECKKLTGGYVNQAKRELKIFKKSVKKDLLSAMTSGVKSSVYWKILKNIKMK